MKTGQLKRFKNWAKNSILMETGADFKNDSWDMNFQKWVVF